MPREPFTFIKFSTILVGFLISGACQPQAIPSLQESAIPGTSPPEQTSTSAPAATVLPPTETACESPGTTITPKLVPQTRELEAMQIATNAFEPEGLIPEKYTCFGDNISPGLEWSNVPPEAQSMLLIVYDLDAGQERGASTPLGFAHWIIYNIPPEATGYAENLPAGERLEDSAMQGTNDFAQFREQGAVFPGGAQIKFVVYDGPCPPSGTHRYTFALHAIDILLDLPPGATLNQVLQTMEGHILTRAEVIGSYTPPQ